MENLNHRTQQICSCDKSAETEIQKLLHREQERISSDAIMETARAAELVEELESLGGRSHGGGWTGGVTSAAGQQHQAPH